MRESCHYAARIVGIILNFLSTRAASGRERPKVLRAAADVVPPSDNWISVCDIKEPPERSNFLSISRRNIQIRSICIFIISAECEIKQKHALALMFFFLWRLYFCVFFFIAKQNSLGNVLDAPD